MIRRHPRSTRTDPPCPYTTLVRSAAGMADFVQRLDRPSNGIWSACAGDRMLGCVVLDGEDLGGDAGHLRWFIVDDGARGAGIGSALLGAALSFADARGFDRVELWTFAGLGIGRANV